MLMSPWSRLLLVSPWIDLRLLLFPRVGLRLLLFPWVGLLLMSPWAMAMPMRISMPDFDSGGSADKNGKRESLHIKSLIIY